MDKALLKEVMADQREFFLSEKTLIKREIDLKQYLNTRQIVLISGIRRCGKSSLLYLIKDDLNLDLENVLYFNFDDERLGGFEVNDFNKLIEIHIELFNISNFNKVVIFFDEIQNMSGWEKFLNRMYERGNKIFVTGSNAKLLGSEIATSLTGRNLVLNLYPFSFSEFLNYNKISIDQEIISTKSKSKIKSYFNKYLISGGFPLAISEDNLEIIQSYYKDILYRDIIARYGLSQTEELKVLGSYLLTNIGKLFSYSTLQNVTKIKSLSTLKNYLNYFENSYLLFYLKKFDYSLKKQILNSRKVYSIDLAFSSQLGFKFSEDIGRILENLVFIELIRRNQEIYYHKEKLECDFVIKEGINITKAIQVTKNLSDESTKNREFAGLLDAMDSYNLEEGLILTEDYESEEFIDERKIVIKPIWKWLLEK